MSAASRLCAFCIDKKRYAPLSVSRQQHSLQGGFCRHLPMHQPNLPRPLLHRCDKADQTRLIGMGRIPADAVHGCANVVAPAIELNVAIARPEALDGMAGRASDLITDEQHVVAGVAEHGLEVIDDAAAGTHAVAGDNDGGSRTADQMIENLLVVGVAVDSDKLLERQRSSAGLHASLGFFVPVVFEFAVGLGEAAGQGGVEDDGQAGPVGFGRGIWCGFEIFAGVARSHRGLRSGWGVQLFAVDDVFELVEQFLGAADAEGGDQHGAAVGQGMFDDLLQALAAGAAVLVQAVAVGAFQHQDVGAAWWYAGLEDRRAGGTEVAGEYDTRAGFAWAVLHIDFHIGGAEHMGSALQPHLGMQAFVIVQGEPVIVGQRDDSLLHLLEVALDLFLVTAEGEFERVLQHDGQQFGRGITAEDRPLEAGGQQIGNASHMVGMHMGNDQRVNAIQGEFNTLMVGPRTKRRGIGALKKPAVDQQAAVLRHMQLVAGTGYPILGAMMGDVRVLHRLIP